jgi:Tfp pilus assembly PilM family ATPase
MDIGSRIIKLAQVEQRQGQWRIARRWLATAGAPLGFTREALEGGILAAKKSELSAIRKFFAGAECAASLSMSLVNLRTLVLPDGLGEDLRQVVGEELAAEEELGGADFTFDFWDTQERSGESVYIAALAAPATIAARVGGDLLRAGYRCGVLDGLPCVLARAAALADSDAEQPAAVLDLGDSCWTLVIAAQGRPRFTRVLRGGGLRSVLRPLTESLQLSHEQAVHLLNRFAVAGETNQFRGPANVVRQMVAKPLGDLVEELERTLDYVAQQFPKLKPARLWLVGGGAVMQHLPAHLSEQVGVPARAWRLPGAADDNANDEAIFGAAAALSVLKWEAQPCT